MKLAIDRDRLLADLTALGKIGRGSDGGISRRALSAEDAEARRYVAGRMREAGLEVRHDEVGNLRGTRAGRRLDAPVVMTGSHLDTVPSGGPLDGPLGVVGAVAAIESLNRAEVDTEQAIEVVVFVGEEGSRFPRGTIGSAAISGHVAVDAILALTDPDGVRYGHALASYGDLGPAIPARAWPGQIAAYVELHVEQGAVLEGAGVPIGVVTAIAGLVQHRIIFHGDANHAGATPMALRKDALLVAAEWALAVERTARELGGGAVATVGKLEVSPGGKNIIPGRVEAIVDLRAPDRELLDALDTRICALPDAIARARGVTVETARLQRVEPGPMAERPMRAVEEAARACELSSQRMVSGAIHDALHLAEICPATMIFVPSIGGKSHCPNEDTAPAELENGCRVLAHTLAILAG
ncbi:MAG TPA: Zn-dependent hydrolase [Polyangia bacterium]